MKSGLDTSVVLRLLTGKPQDLALLAASHVEASLSAGHTVFVSDLVVSESYFALQHHYGLSKTQALDVLGQFLQQSGVEPLGAARRVLGMPNQASAKPGLVDRLIHAEYSKVADEMLTFEKPAARLSKVRVLRA